MAFDVGVICAMVSAVGLGSLIAQAALITGGTTPGDLMEFFLGEKSRGEI